MILVSHFLTFSSCATVTQSFFRFCHLSLRFYRALQYSVIFVIAHQSFATVTQPFFFILIDIFKISSHATILRHFCRSDSVIFYILSVIFYISSYAIVTQLFFITVTQSFFRFHQSLLRFHHVLQ
jgi:hypothetical protein